MYNARAKSQAFSVVQARVALAWDTESIAAACPAGDGQERDL